jgi:cytoskeletal protein CcmA (bactofilin family)
MFRNTNVIIDPVAMNIVNRIAKGSHSRGAVHSVGGILIEGTFEGDLIVHDGPLVLMEGAELIGSITAHADAYVFGQVGRATGDTELTVLGEGHFAATARSVASIKCAIPHIYHGAKLEGMLDTVQKEQRLAEAA